MKKTISFILTISLIISIFAVASVSVSAAETVLLNFDSTDNFTAAFNATMAIETNETKEGTGSMRFGYTVPTGQTSNIGGMLFYDYTSSQDFTSYDGFRIDVYSPMTMSGNGGFIQVNFVTNSTDQDGYNYNFPLDNITAGWNTIVLAKTAYATYVNEASWSNINRIRLTWFNTSQITLDFMLLDNLTGYVGEPPSSDSTSDLGHTPYTTTDGYLMINNADSTDGWSGEFNATVSAASQYKEGTGAVTVKSTVPQGQASNIGAMAFIKFPAADISSYKSITIQYRLDNALDGTHQLQFNFCSEGRQDGYNYIMTVGSLSAGWHTLVIDLSTLSDTQGGLTSWSAIDTIRFTWFNVSQSATAVGFTLDEILARTDVPVIEESSTTSSTTSSAITSYAADPYVMDDGSLMINDAEAVAGWSTSFNSMLLRTTASIQGSYAIRLVSKVPLAQDANVGSMAFIDYENAFSLADYDYITYQFYMGSVLEGAQTLQMNFCSPGNEQDGFNCGIKLDGLASGRWYTVVLEKSDFETAVSTADWSNITRMRITWFNHEQDDVNETFSFDNIRAYKAGASNLPESNLDDPTYTLGDVNEDGAVDASDALLTLQHVARKSSLTTYKQFLADVAVPSGVSSSDALYILQLSASRITEFDKIPDNSEPESQYESYTPEPVTINDSVVDNGAYDATDGGADTSFSLTTLGLKPRTIYVCKAGVVENKGSDVARLVYSLQGLLNREFGMDDEHTMMIYILSDASDPYWLEYINSDTNAGSPFSGFNVVSVNTWSAFLRTFFPQIQQCGYTAWDPSVPATANVAATICGVDGFLPVQSGSDLEETLIEKGVTKNMDLVGKFTGATTGSPKNDAYRWALDNYFNRCSYQYLAYTVDGAPNVSGNVCNTDPDAMGDCLENHDYLIARRAFFFDLDPYSGEAAKDAGGGATGLDSETMKMIFARRYERSGGNIGVLMGFVPWWLKYASDCGNSYAGTYTSYNLEWLLSELIACYNLAKEADAAHPVSMTNGSVYYKYVVEDEFVNNKTAKTVSYNSNVHYFTFYIGDYDSSAWVKKYVAQFWMSDSARGQVDLMWAMNPNLSYRVPMCFEYMYDNLTSCDYMTAGEGAGYLIPTGLFAGKVPARLKQARPYASGAQAYADYSKALYDLMDMDITGFLIPGENSIDGDIMDMYNQFSPVGTLHNYSSFKFTQRNGVPFIFCNTGIDETTADTSMYSHSFSTMGSYNFSAFRTISESPTTIKTIVDRYTSYCAGRGKTVQYVDPYSFFSLARSSGQLVAK